MKKISLLLMTLILIFELSCSVESRFLAGLLRYKNIPARYRAGYFKNTMENVEHIIEFWENVSRYREEKV